VGVFDVSVVVGEVDEECWIGFYAKIVRVDLGRFFSYR
jgi:hypothetical protein